MMGKQEQLDRIKKGDAKILEGEQNKAKRTVRLWLSLSGN